MEDHIGQVILRRRLATTCLLSMGLSSLGLLYFRSYTRHSYLRYLRSSFEDAFLKFEQLLLPLSHFLSARTVMLKWMESLRPPRTNYLNRRRRRKRSSSDSEDHQIRRHRKRTKIDLVHRKQSQLTLKPLVQASKQRLESAYRENSKPSGPMMLELARQIGFDRDVVGSLDKFSPKT